MAHHPHDWPAIHSLYMRARAARLLDHAQDVATQATPAIRRRVSGPQGVTETEEYRTDPGMIGQALAGLLPGVHGRAAGRGGATQINVAGNAQVFGGPPPASSLDDFDAPPAQIDG